MSTRLGTVLLACVLLAAGTAVGDEDPMKPPEAGTMRFSTSADSFPVTKQPVEFTAADSIYALVGFGKPWRELMKSTKKGTNAVLRLHVGGEFKKHHLFFPAPESFEKDTYVLEVVPEPAKATQFTYDIPKFMASLAPGKHQLTVELWSFAAKEGTLAKGSFTFVATEDGQKRLLAVAEAIKEAKQKKQAAAAKPPKPTQPRVTVRKGGSELLYFRGDEIVLNGAMVGKIEGSHVRKGGAIVGEIRGTTFRHEGSDKWKLDQGNLYPGREIRWEGAVIGDIRKDGTIWWEGSSWGSVKPYGGNDAETMRIFAALWYFSDFFRKK